MKTKGFLIALFAFAIIFSAASAQTILSSEDIESDSVYYSNAELSEEGFAIVVTVLSMLLFIVLMQFSLAIYIYSSFAYMSLAKKTKTEPIWLAWIPIVRYYLISKIAKMPWWPILFLIGCAVPYPMIGLASMVAFSVFFVIWSWKIFERVGRPGWWALLMIIPVAGPIIFFVLIGIAAWGKAPKARPVRKKTLAKKKKRK